MQPEVNPKRIEKRLIFMQSRDGMLDMFFGLMLVIVGTNDIFSFYEWQVPWYLRFGIIILIIPFLLGKFLITTPRLGFVKMKPVAWGRKQSLIIFLSVSVFLSLLLLAAAIFDLPGFNYEQIGYNPVLEFAFLVFAMGFAGWLIGAYSLFFAGIATGFAWPVAEMIKLETIAGLPQELFSLCLPGLIILVIGMIRFSRFLKTHPKENLKADYEPEK